MKQALFAILFFSFFSTYAQTQVKTTCKSKTQLKAYAKKDSKSLATVSAGESLVLIGYSAKYWKVKYKNLQGYIPEYQVSANKATADYKAKLTAKKSVSKTTTSNSKSTTTEAKQCLAKTKAGERCKRKTKNKSGKCYQHQ